MKPSQALNLLSQIYLCSPTRETLAAWKLLMPNCAELLPALAGTLRFMNLSDEKELEELHWDYSRLFIGPYKLPCPPWESVYTSPNRLMMQSAHDEVLEAYREMDLAVNNPGILPDHIGMELNFAALLAEKIHSDPGGKARAVALKFWASHLKNWIPQFTADLEKSASSPFYKALGQDTRYLIMEE